MFAVAAGTFAGCGAHSVAPQLPVTQTQVAAGNSAIASQLLKAARPSRYTVMDLGTLGGTFSEAVGISNGGEVSGYSTLPGDSSMHGYYWRNGVMTDSGTLGGPNSFAPEEAPPSENGMVAGMSDTSTLDPYSDPFCGIFDFEQTSPYVCRAFVWNHGALTALPTLGGPNGAAIGINNSGELAGTAETAERDAACVASGIAFLFYGAIWDSKRGAITRLPPLYSDNLSSAGGGINNSGETAGTSGTCANGPIEAVLWRNGSPINLGTLGGAVFNIAFAINDKHEVVGSSDLPGDQTHHGFLWRKGVMIDLGSIYGLPVSLAASINNRSEVAGFSQDSTGSIFVPWLWQNGNMTDVNTLIRASSPWIFIEALGINDRGQIVGYGYNSTGQIHGLLATPCSETSDRTCAEVRRSQSIPAVLPEHVLKTLERLHRFTRVRGWPVRS
jgi:probable HAF family extracellular repeat protein